MEGPREGKTEGGQGAGSWGTDLESMLCATLVGRAYNSVFISNPPPSTCFGAPCPWRPPAAGPRAVRSWSSRPEQGGKDTVLKIWLKVVPHLRRVGGGGGDGTD